MLYLRKYLLSVVQGIDIVQYYVQDSTNYGIHIFHLAEIHLVSIASVNTEHIHCASHQMSEVYAGYKDCFNITLMPK